MSSAADAAVLTPGEPPGKFVAWLGEAIDVVLGTLSGAAYRRLAVDSSSSSSSQVTASAQLLLVLVARSLVVLHDALEAAAAAAGMTAADLLYQCVAQEESEDAEQQQQQQQQQEKDVTDEEEDSAGQGSRASSSSSRASSSSSDSDSDSDRDSSSGSSSAARKGPDQSTVWIQYQHNVVSVAGALSQALAAAVLQPQQQQQPVVWPHLLQLHTVPELVTAVQKLQATLAGSYIEIMLHWSRTSSGSSYRLVHMRRSWQRLQQQQQRQRLDDVVSDLLSCCRTIAAAVPLPEVCNNPSCECLEGISEAAAAVKACGGCGARYCSRECQEKHYKVHKRACRRLRPARGTA
jgi:hypothetical protein